MAHTRTCLASWALLLTGCINDGAIENQALGPASGFFTRLGPTDVYCELSDIGDPEMHLSMTFGEEKKVATIAFAPTTHKAERVQRNATFQYQTGQTTAAAVEVERFAAIIDPRLGEESRQSAIEQHTSHFFPMYVHRVVVDPATLCDTNMSGAPTSDCLTVPASTLEGSRFWCHVAVTSPVEFSE